MSSDTNATPGGRPSASAAQGQGAFEELMRDRGQGNKSKSQTPAAPNRGASEHLQDGNFTYIQDGLRHARTFMQATSATVQTRGAEILGHERFGELTRNPVYQHIAAGIDDIGELTVLNKDDFDKFLDMAASATQEVLLGSAVRESPSKRPRNDATAGHDGPLVPPLPGVPQPLPQQAPQQQQQQPPPAFQTTGQLLQTELTLQSLGKVSFNERASYDRGIKEMVVVGLKQKSMGLTLTPRLQSLVRHIIDAEPKNLYPAAMRALHEQAFGEIQKALRDAGSSFCTDFAKARRDEPLTVLQSPHTEGVTGSITAAQNIACIAAAYDLVSSDVSIQPTMEPAVARAGLLEELSNLRSLVQTGEVEEHAARLLRLERWTKQAAQHRSTKKDNNNNNNKKGGNNNNNRKNNNHSPHDSKAAVRETTTTSYTVTNGAGRGRGGGGQRGRGGGGRGGGGAASTASASEED